VSVCTYIRSEWSRCIVRLLFTLQVAEFLAKRRNALLDAASAAAAAEAPTWVGYGVEEVEDDVVYRGEEPACHSNVYVYVCVCVCVFTYMHIYIHVRVHILIYTHRTT
jgi:hypothetical protein